MSRRLGAQGCGCTFAGMGERIASPSCPVDAVLAHPREK